MTGNSPNVGNGTPVNSGKSVLVVGALILDAICHVPALPQSGEGVVAESSQTMLGGCAYNSACAIKELGFPVALFAPIGLGPRSNFVREALSARGLEGFDVPKALGGMCETSQICDNGLCMCMVEPGGERTMLTLPGIDRRYERAWFDNVRADDHACVIVSGYEIEPPEGDAIVEFLEDNPSLPVYFGPGPRICGISRSKMARINALRPVWHLNDQEALAYTGASSLEEAGRMMLAQCNNAVVITEGSRGSRVFSGDGETFVETQAVAAVDTVGAGDAHIGVVAALRSAGYPWEETLSLANRVAGIVCGHAGASVPAGALDNLRA